MAFRQLDRYDRFDVRPWPANPERFPLYPFQTRRGWVYAPTRPLRLSVRLLLKLALWLDNRAPEREADDMWVW